MSKNVAVPDDLYDNAAALAARDQMSIDDFVSAAVANQLAGRQYLEARARLFSRQDFERALEQIPDVEADEQDRM